VWVLNGTTGGTTDDTGTVTEISAVDGTVTRELDGVLGQGFAEWRRLAASGPYVWVLNVINPLSLTQLDAVTGNVLRDIPVDRNYYQIVTAGSLVWLLGDGYATAFNASTGHAVRTVTAGLTRLSVSIGDGSRIWISQASGDSASVDEYDAATGAWLRNASGSRYHLDIGPGIVDKYLPMAAAGGRVWVLSSYSGSVTEFAAG
jgi:hypothetical protein